MEPKQLHHVAFVVPNLDLAMQELSAALGVDWHEPKDGQVEDWLTRYTSSVQGPPYYEIIQGPPDSPWDATAGPRVDHLAFASADPLADKERLLDLGMPLSYDFWETGGTSSYHQAVHCGTQLAFFDENSTNFSRAAKAS